MAINNKLRVSELDFDEIKANLKEFLSSQEQFSDYNYEGSALSTIIDLLAYNTHYNSILANMLANEMFIDSAVLRGSVVSRAKELGYYPMSYRSPSALVDITVNNPVGNPSSILLPKNTKFTATVDNKLYSFITLDNYETSPVSGVYTFSNVSLFEGSLKTHSYVVNTQSSTKYIIPDINVDLEHIRVYVQNSATNLTIVRYLESKDITAVNSTSNVFFIQGTADNKYEIYFGDGILGVAPENGNIVILEYITTSGADTNNCKVFKLAGSIAGSSNVSIVTNLSASGGASAETADSIRKNAPKAFTAQNRLVTAGDIKTLLPTLYTNIKSVSVWGGDENVPPDYGVVFVSIEPKNYGTLSPEQKNQVLSNIGEKKIISVQYKIIDPQYIYIRPNSTVYYDADLTQNKKSAIKLLVKNSIATYNNTDLSKFDGQFRYSKLSKLIDESDKSIISNITNFSVYQYMVPVYGVETQYTVEFYNPIYQNEYKSPEQAVSSTGFRILNDDKVMYIEDDGNQYIRLYYIKNGTRTYVNNNVGTVNYSTGKIVLNLNIASFIPSSDDSTGIEVSIKTESNDIIPVRNVILRIKESDIITDAIIDPIASGETVSGAKYVFTSAR